MHYSEDVIFKNNAPFQKVKLRNASQGKWCLGSVLKFMYEFAMQLREYSREWVDCAEGQGVLKIHFLFGLWRSWVSLSVCRNGSWWEKSLENYVGIAVWDMEWWDFGFDLNFITGRNDSNWDSFLQWLEKLAGDRLLAGRCQSWLWTLRQHLSEGFSQETQCLFSKTNLQKFYIWFQL